MEMEFCEKAIRCLRERAVEVLYQEETAELILPDSYPDVRAIGDASAVCCLRDKETASGVMMASGAFQAAVIYDAEDGEICGMEAWLPFTVRLNRDAISPDDIGCATVRIRSVDGRVLNSRKIMVRVSYAVRMTVYESSPLKIWEAAPDDGIYLRHRTVPACFPTAVAEKPATASENVDIRGAASPVRRVMKALPEFRLAEVKAVDDKAVIKGEIQIHMLCLLENGGLYVWDTSIPLSQYLEFEEEIGDGRLEAACHLTDFQVEENEAGGYLVSCGVQLQVFLWRTVELELITDGYSVNRDFDAVYQTLKLPELLDVLAIPNTAEAVLHGKPEQVVDCTAWVDFPVCRRSADEVSAAAPVTMRVCYLNKDGRVCGETVKAEASGQFALSQDANCCADADRSGTCYVSMSGDTAVVSCGIQLQARCFAERSVDTMAAATVGELRNQTEERPSLVVRRTLTGVPLWNFAKQYNSSVSAIRDANGIESDSTVQEGFLLIPVS